MNWISNILVVFQLTIEVGSSFSPNIVTITGNYWLLFTKLLLVNNTQIVHYKNIQHYWQLFYMQPNVYLDHLYYLN